jgi:membrane-bound serine protease (ClpP class)
MFHTRTPIPLESLPYRSAVRADARASNDWCSITFDLAIESKLRECDVVGEFMNPGALVPGTIGAICLLIGLYALALLPVNYAGLGLIVLGLGLMVAEAFTPSFGILGVGGVAAFALGAAILVDTEAPDFQISWALIGAVAVMSLVLTLIVVRLAIRSHGRRVATGIEEMAGVRGEVLDWHDGKGHVLAHGERWGAISGAPLSTGQPVRVIGMDGLVLKVEPDSTDQS